jgi:hypothetical protein
MATTDLTPSPDELALLQRLVEAARAETRTEFHRTHFSPVFPGRIEG